VGIGAEETRNEWPVDADEKRLKGQARSDWRQSIE